MGNSKLINLYYKSGVTKEFIDLEFINYLGFLNRHELHKLKRECKKFKINLSDKDITKSKRIAKLLLSYYKDLDKYLNKGTGIIFYGSSGSGKSLLMISLIKEIIAYNKKAYVVSFNDLYSLFQKSWKDDYDVKKEFNDIITYPILGVEEFNLDNTSSSAKMLTQKLIIDRFNDKKSLFLTTSLTSPQLKTFLPESVYNKIYGNSIFLNCSLKFNWQKLMHKRLQKSLR